jgi:nucleotide-binding universal stress UspA family protein
MKILLALDSSPCSEAATRAVMAQFAPAGHEIRVFHAVDWEPQLPIPFQFAAGPDAAAHVYAARDEMVQQAQQFVARIADRLRIAGYSVTTDVRAEGAARDAILQAASEWGAELIVLGSHGRSGLDRFVLGSVSEGVVRRAHCSVQVVRPTLSTAAANREATSAAVHGS